MAKEKCLCGKEYSPDCDWRQGRCPHHSPLVNVQPRDTSRAHFYISLVKSGVRIIAGAALAGGGWLEMNPYLFYAGVFIIVAELLGIAEELF